MELALVAFLLLSFLAKLMAVFDDIDSNIVWVVAEGHYESHYDACSRVHTRPVQIFNNDSFWNQRKFSQVSEGLKCSPSDESLDSIVGCCTPGLWLDSTTQKCFTKSFGSEFSNFGWLNESMHPIYTCTRPKPDTKSIVLSSVAYLEGHLRVYGNWTPSLQAKDLTVWLGPGECENLEMCNGVCQPCSDDECSPNGLCLNVGGSSHCHMFCSGKGDPSCPCGTVCDTVAVHSQQQNSDINAHLCTPIPFASGSSVCNGYTHKSHGRLQQQLRCTPRQAVVAGVLDGSDKEAVLAPMSVSVFAAGESGASSVAVYVHGGCQTNADCHDGDLCTVDSCLLAVCRYRYVDGCESTSPQIRARLAPYAYIGYRSTRQAAEQAQVSALLRANGTVSGVSFHDDYPLDLIHLPFNFSYFGNTVRSVSVNPNGVLQLPPVERCSSMIGTMYCPTYSTASNTISLWGSDWNTESKSSSRVYTLVEQVQSLQEGREAEAGSGSAGQVQVLQVLHVLYSDMVKFQPGVKASSKAGSDFSASLYSDGSISLRYHSVQSPVAVTDTAGLHASQRFTSTGPRDLPLNRYHSEQLPVTSAIANHTDVTYCLLATTACVVNSCVGPSDELEILWDGVTCQALVGDFSVSCAFAGGLNSSVAVYHKPTSSGPGMLRCAVPRLALRDGTVVTVDLVHTPSSITPTRWVGGNRPPVDRAAFTVIEDGEGPDSKSVFGVYKGFGGEVSRSKLLVRYSSAGGAQCGCAALPSLPNQSCDAMLVCGGDASTGDCYGTPFGSAYVDSCGTCAGGETGVSPSSACSVADADVNYLSMKVFSQVLFVVGFVFITSLTLTSVSYLTRMAFLRRGMIDVEQLQLELEAMAMRGPVPPGPTAASRGLSLFECDALGEVKYSSSSGPDDSSQRLEEGGTAKECSICLTEFEDGDRCRCLPEPCGHLFHQSCIDEWFRLSVSCPMCKRSIRNILEGGDGTVDQRSQVWEQLAGGPASNRPPRAVRAVRPADESRRRRRELFIRAILESVQASRAVARDQNASSSSNNESGGVELQSVPLLSESSSSSSSSSAAAASSRQV